MSLKAVSKARLAESVSTVEPDLDETTSTVCSRPPASASPSIAASTWLGGGRVEDHERDAGGLRDHFGRERGPAHAREHDPGDTLGDELVAKRRDLGDERSRDDDGLDPAEALGGLRLGRRAPQRCIACRDPRSDEVGDQAGSVSSTTDLTRPVRWISKLTRADSGRLRCLESRRDGRLQLVPRRDELLDALVFEHLGDIGEVDADGGELSKTPWASS